MGAQVNSNSKVRTLVKATDSIKIIILLSVG
jgi:hypothetical protein